MSDWTEVFFQDAWHDVQRGSFAPAASAEQARQVRELLGLRAGQSVLDVPCGNGRIGRELAAHGLRVTGVDLSEVMIADGRAAATAAGIEMTLVHADMRTIDYDSEFDVAINFWTSIGYFDRATDLAFSRRIHAALVPGGRFLIEAHSAETIFPRFQARSWGDCCDVRVLEARRYDARTGRMETDWTFMKGGTESTGRSSIRLYTACELGALLGEAGFSDWQAFGDLDGSSFGVGARRLVIVATR